jgi:hypothetical protein
VDRPNVTGGRITYYPDPQGSLEEPLGEETERDALTAAFATWAGASESPVRFVEDLARPAYDRKAADNVNWIGWKASTLGPLTLAATFTSATDGVITDADIMFNDTAQYVKWATTTPGTEGYADIQAVATHEIGHLAGLDHSPIPDATMSSVQPVATIFARTLEPDDVSALLAAYPSSDPRQTGTATGSVQVGKKRAPRGVLVCALSARTGLVAGSTLSEKDGTWRIPGLVAGPYFLAAVPLSSVDEYTGWWSRAPLRLRPAWREEDQPGGGRGPAVTTARAGFFETKQDLVVARPVRGDLAEPDDGPALAREIAVGGAAVGTLDESLDEDWFSLPLDGANPVDVRVRSWGLGAAADADLALVAPDGETVLEAVVDDRLPADAENYYGLPGVQRDATLADWTPPAAGTYYVRIRAQPDSEHGRPSSFYLLHVLLASSVPDPDRTTATVFPDITRVGGPDVVLTAVPRDGRGDRLGAGATVSAIPDTGGGPFPLADNGDGTYSATVPAPAAAGEIRYSIEVTSSGGHALVPAATTLQVAGDADGARSTLVADPHRIESDGQSTAVLLFVPRDSAGLALGAGLDVTFAFDGPSSGAIFAPADLGDGTYQATLRSAFSDGSARVTVLVEGRPTGISRMVGFGWDLLQVAVDLGGQASEAEGLPGISRREQRDFGRASDFLDAVLAALGEADDVAACGEGSAAVAALLRAARSLRWPDAAESAGDLAEALRRRADYRIGRVIFQVPDPPGERRLRAAKAILARADAAVDEGDAARGARLVAAAMRKARSLL